MRLTALAGALLLVVSVCGCRGSDESKLESQVRTFMETNKRYPNFDAEVKRINCEQLEGVRSMACEIDFEDAPAKRWAVDRKRSGDFHFRACIPYLHSLPRVYNDYADEDPACFKTIPGIADASWRTS
jgi:hypothetical protein